MVELARIDIIMEALLLLSHFALPRKGPLEVAVKNGLCWTKYNSRLNYYPTHPEIDHGMFIKCKGVKFYQDAMDAMPINVPEPRG